MTTRALQHCFGAILAFIAMWPLVHFVLTHVAQINPWKLFGLAMYSTYYKAEVTLWDNSSTPPVKVRPSEYSPSTRELVRDLRVWRGTLGRFVDPEPYAKRIQEANPQVRCLGVRLGIRRFDRSTSILRTNWTSLGCGEAIPQDSAKPAAVSRSR